VKGLDKPSPASRPQRLDSLVVKFLPFVQRIARRHSHNCWIQVDDLESVAAMALMRAVGRYTPARESTWKGYLTTRIKGALNDYMREWNGVRNRRRRERPAEFEVACAHPFTEELENRELAARLLGSLADDRERKVMLWYFGHDMTLAEIAERLGLSEARVHQVLKRARLRLTGTADNLNLSTHRVRKTRWAHRKRSKEQSPKLITARNRKIRERYARGDLSHADLAKMFKISQPLICKILNGWTPRSEMRTKKPQTLIDEIRAQYRRGDISTRQLARRYEMSPSYVWKLLRGWRRA